MNIYATKKYVIHENTERPKFAIDSTYNGRRYKSVVLKKSQCDTIRCKQDNHIRLRYTIYENYVTGLFLFAVISAGLLIPWVVVSIAELRACMQYVQELSFIEKQKQLDSF